MPTHDIIDNRDERSGCKIAVQEGETDT